MDTDLFMAALRVVDLSGEGMTWKDNDLRDATVRMSRLLMTAASKQIRHPTWRGGPSARYEDLLNSTVLSSGENLDIDEYFAGTRPVTHQEVSEPQPLINAFVKILVLQEEGSHSEEEISEAVGDFGRKLLEYVGEDPSTSLIIPDMSYLLDSIYSLRELEASDTHPFDASFPLHDTVIFNEATDTPQWFSHNEGIPQSTAYNTSASDWSSLFTGGEQLSMLDADYSQVDMESSFVPSNDFSQDENETYPFDTSLPLGATFIYNAAETPQQTASEWLPGYEGFTRPIANSTSASELLNASATPPQQSAKKHLDARSFHDTDYHSYIYNTNSTHSKEAKPSTGSSLRTMPNNFLKPRPPVAYKTTPQSDPMDVDTRFFSGLPPVALDILHRSDPATYTSSRPTTVFKTSYTLKERPRFSESQAPSGVLQSIGSPPVTRRRCSNPRPRSKKKW